VVEVVIVKKFTFAVSSPDEFLVYKLVILCPVNSLNIDVQSHTTAAVASASAALSSVAISVDC